MGDPISAEWGYFTFSELREASAEGKVIDAETEALMARFPVFVEWDEYWTPKPFREIAWQRL